MHAVQPLQECSIGIMLQDTSVSTVLEKGQNTGHVYLQCSSPKQAVIPVVIINESNHTVGSIIVLTNMPTHTNRIKLTIHRTGNFLQCTVEESDVHVLLAKQQIEYNPQGQKKRTKNLMPFYAILLLSIEFFLFATLSWLMFFKQSFVLEKLRQFLDLILP